MSFKENIDLSIQRRKYNSRDSGLINCPECGALLIKKNCSVILCVKSDIDTGEFMTNLSGSHFYNKCPVVVFDNEKIEQAALIGINNNKNVKYIIAGIVDFSAIPEEKRHLEIGIDEDPTPLVTFLPDLNTTTYYCRKETW